MIQGSFLSQSNDIPLVGELTGKLTGRYDCRQVNYLKTKQHASMGLLQSLRKTCSFHLCSHQLKQSVDMNLSINIMKRYMALSAFTQVDSFASTMSSTEPGTEGGEADRQKVLCM